MNNTIHALDLQTPQVTLRAATEEESRTLKQRPSRMAKIWNSAKLAWDTNFCKLLAPGVNAFEQVGPFESYLMRTWHVTKCPAAMKAVLQHHRNSTKEEALFAVPTPNNKAIGALNDLFPGETLTIEDSLLHCSDFNSPKYRTILDRYFKWDFLKDHLDEVVQVIRQEIASWPAGKEVNVSQRMRVVTSGIISKLILGHDGPYEQIASAIHCMNRGFIERYVGKAVSHPEEYQEAIKVIQNAIHAVFQKDTPPPLVKELKENQELTDLQKKLMIFLLFFAGQENTASALTYIIWQLALHPDQQEVIREEAKASKHESLEKRARNVTSVTKAVRLGLFQHPPVYSIGRLAKRDLVLIFDRPGAQYKYLIPKDEQINPCPVFAGQDPKLGGHPRGSFNLTEMNAHRLFHLPFGSGPHKCPGELLAKLEMKYLLTDLIENYSFTTSIKEKDVEQVGLVLMTLSKDIVIHLEKRINK